MELRHTDIVAGVGEMDKRNWAKLGMQIAFERIRRKTSPVGDGRDQSKY